MTLLESPPREFSTITRALARRQLVVDRIFDEVFPWHLRRASGMYWTPVDVALHAASLLAIRPGASSAHACAGSSTDPIW
jgi:hypothetical protein